MSDQEKSIDEDDLQHQKITEIPNPPSILVGEGKKKYFQIANMLEKEGKFKIGDELALTALCVNYQRWIQTEKVIKSEKSLTFVTETGYRQQIPELSIARDCMKTMLTFIREFSLTPKERAKLKELIDAGNNVDKELDEMVQ